MDPYISLTINGILWIFYLRKSQHNANWMGVSVGLLSSMSGLVASYLYFPVSSVHFKTYENFIPRNTLWVHPTKLHKNFTIFSIRLTFKQKNRRNTNCTKILYERVKKTHKNTRCTCSHVPCAAPLRSAVYPHHMAHASFAHAAEWAPGRAVRTCSHG